MSLPILPLEGVRVIEFCNVAAGPYCAMLLADMGAEVIKVESPEGDMLRQWPPHSNGFSENFASLNRGKLSIALDLKNPTDQATARALMLSADVVLENNRPGVMERLGLGYTSFKEAKPSLIYCSISAFGQVGPRSHEGGFDVTLQAASGVMSVTGEPDGPPSKCGVPIADFTAGLYGAYAIAAMLAQVRAGGPGGHIDVPMFGTTMAVGALQTSEYFGTGRDPKPLGSAHPRNAPYQAFRARDKAFVIAAGNDKLWHSVCEVIHHPELAHDPRFKTTKDRATHQRALKTVLEEIFSQQDAAYWLTAMRSENIPCSPINTFSEALSDPQTVASAWVVPLSLPSGVETSTFRSPLSINGQGFPVRRGPPLLDGDRELILQSLKPKGINDET